MEYKVPEEVVVTSAEVAENPEFPKKMAYEGIRVSYVPETRFKNTTQFQGSNEVIAWAYTMGMLEDVRERMYAIYVDNKNKPLGYRLLGAGGVRGVLVDPKVVFGPAVALHARGIILLHNHPGGDSTPSQDDLNLTERLKIGAPYVDVEIMDHLVVGRENWRSIMYPEKGVHPAVLTRPETRAAENPLDELDQRPDDDYDPEQLAMGIEIEFEHTQDPEIAKTIAKDHLDEMPDYYTRLAIMEGAAGHNPQPIFPSTEARRLSEASANQGTPFGPVSPERAAREFDQRYGGWITPDGEIYFVGVESHEKHAKKLGFGNYPISYFNLFKKGFVRFANGDFWAGAHRGAYRREIMFQADNIDSLKATLPFLSAFAPDTPVMVSLRDYAAGERLPETVAELVVALRAEKARVSQVLGRGGIYDPWRGPQTWSAFYNPYEETPEVIYGANPCYPEGDVARQLDYEGMRVRYDVLKASKAYAFNDADAAYNFMVDLGVMDDLREQVYAIYANQKNRLIGYRLIGAATLSEALVHPREIFGPAVALAAASVIIVHNHPSGQTTPSPQDMELAKRLKEVSILMGIRLLDFMIVGRSGYTSFNELGLV